MSLLMFVMLAYVCRWICSLDSRNTTNKKSKVHIFGVTVEGKGNLQKQKKELYDINRCVIRIFFSMSHEKQVKCLYRISYTYLSEF